MLDVLHVAALASWGDYLNNHLRTAGIRASEVQSRGARDGEQWASHVERGGPL